MKYALITLISVLALSGCGEDELVMPESLRGTITDGTLTVDQDGHFVADNDALRVFDYFLTGEGEIPRDKLDRLVKREIAKHLDEPAASEAISFYDRYADYRQEVSERITTGDMTGLKSDLSAIHGRHVANAPGLANDLQQFDRAIALRAVLRDRSLSGDERAASIAHIEATMTPIAERAADDHARAASRVHLALRDAEAEARQAGATGADIAALRTARVGEDAAARLTALDGKRAAWKQKLRDYRAAKATLKAASLSHDSAALTDLRARHFTATEALRVTALEKTGQLDAAAQ